MAATARRDTLTKVSTALFLAADTTLAVSGAADEWLQTCCDALEAGPRFSVENVSEDDFQVKAKYHRGPVWATLTVTLVPEGTDSTRINANAAVLPNLFTLIFHPATRVLARFTRAIVGSTPATDGAGRR